MFNHVTHAKYIILALEANVQSWIRHDFADINIRRRAAMISQLTGVPNFRSVAW